MKGSDKELDPGMRYLVKAGATELGTIVVITSGGRTVEYYILAAALPGGTSTLTVSAQTETQAPTTYTFAVDAAAFASTQPPPSSSTTFVDSTNHIGLQWDFTLSGSTWSGSATWYNSTSSMISIGNGNSRELNNNTYDSALVYKAANAVP